MAMVPVTRETVMNAKMPKNKLPKYRKINCQNAEK